MAKITELRFLEAAQVAVQTDRDEQVAHLHFRGVQIDPTVVTIPLEQLERLHAHISERLEKEPALFDRPSTRKPAS